MGSIDHLMAALNSGMPVIFLMLLLVPLLGMVSQQQQREWGMRESTNLFYALVTIHSAAITPFLRKGFGKEALTWPGLYAFLLILIVAGFNGSTAMLTYLGAWMGMLLWQRLYSWSLTRRDYVWHSKYEGSSLLPFVGDKIARKRIEPLICAGAGWYFQQAGEKVVGNFLLVGTFSLLVRQSINQVVQDRRLQAMHDAQLEQQWLVHEYRKHGGGH